MRCRNRVYTCSLSLSRFRSWLFLSLEPRVPRFLSSRAPQRCTAPSLSATRYSAFGSSRSSATSMASPAVEPGRRLRLRASASRLCLICSRLADFLVLDRGGLLTSVAPPSAAPLLHRISHFREARLVAIDSQLARASVRLPTPTARMLAWPASRALPLNPEPPAVSHLWPSLQRLAPFLASAYARIANQVSSKFLSKSLVS